MLPPIYRVELSPVVEPFYNALDEKVRSAVDHYFELLARRLILPERVSSETQLIYKVNVPASETPGWATGLRIFFGVRKSVQLIVIVDLGDHTTARSIPARAFIPTSAETSKPTSNSSSEPR